MPVAFTLLMAFTVGCATLAQKEDVARAGSCGEPKPLEFKVTPDMGLPVASMDKIDAVPDLPQRKPEAVNAGGKNYCGPTAVSDALMWLGDNGYPDLLAGLSGLDHDAKQTSLAVTLASAIYMNTDPDDGTGIKELASGLEKYLTEHHVEGFRIAYQGWRTHRTEDDTGITIPTLPFLFLGALGKSAVWINLGWYKAGPEFCTYTRHNGHWVLVVGYYASDPTAPTLHIHDPSGRSGDTPTTERVKLALITDGRLQGSNKGLPRPARDYMQAVGELKTPDGMVGIVDGAIALTFP